MKKKIVTALTGLMIASSVYAGQSDPYAFKVDSLVGIEGGMGSFDMERNQPGAPVATKTYNKALVGLKIGAQTENYRAFFGIRNYFMDGSDYFLTYGGELQYMFNFSKYANFFVGLNAGMLDARFKIGGEVTTRDISDPYFGGDLGFNIHATDSIDIELGGRIITTDAESTQNDASGKLTRYKIDNIVTGYASIIFKYQMD